MKKKSSMTIKAKKPENTTVQNCNFVNKVFDDNALEGLNNICKAIKNISELYLNTKVDMTGIKIDYKE